MEQELKLMKMRLEYNLLIEEQQRSSITSGLPPTNEQAVDLPKIQIESSTTQHEDILPPPLIFKEDKVKTSLEQTATSKDTSNPLKVVHLPKMQEKEIQSSRLISENVSLRPNQGVMIEKISDDHKPITNAKHYYVVFNGLNAGIYEDWETAKVATNGVPNVRHKKFRSLLEATTAAKLFAKEHFCAEAKLINSADCLKPNTFCEALKQPKKTKISLGRPVQTRVKQIVETSSEDDEEKLCIRGFEYWYLEARAASENKLVEERFFTTDNANLSYFNFLKNANPDQVYEAFRYGLVKMIYPSTNLQEIRSFPKGLINAIKKFRVKTSKSEGKADRDIYIKVLSSIPAFNEDGIMLHEPHHIIQIGFSKGEKYTPSRVMPSRVEKKDLAELAKVKFSNLLDKAFEFKDEDRLFVNYVDERILLFSKNSKNVCSEDIQKILHYQQSIGRHDIFKDHYEDICDMIKAKMGSTYSCPLCKATAVIKSSLAGGHKDASPSIDIDEDRDFIFGPPIIPSGPMG